MYAFPWKRETLNDNISKLELLLECKLSESRLRITVENKMRSDDDRGVYILNHLVVFINSNRANRIWKYPIIFHRFVDHQVGATSRARERAAASKTSSERVSSKSPTVRAPLRSLEIEIWCFPRTSNILYYDNVQYVHIHVNILRAVSNRAGMCTTDFVFIYVRAVLCVRKYILCLNLSGG